MKLVALATALLLLVGSADALKISSKPKHMTMTNHKCKVMCQRFGMKALGPDFAQIHHPTECCQKCDEVYKAKSLLEVAAVPKTEPAAQTATGGKPTPAGVPVKR